MSKRHPDLFHEEAARLAKLTASERKEALAVHWRIADDTSLCQKTRDYARYVAETLERLLNLAAKKREK